MKRRPLLTAGLVLILLALVLPSPAAKAGAAPANDNWTGATQIATLPYTGSMNVLQATADPNDPMYGYGGYHNVWYKFTASQDGLLEANTLGSDYDTVLSVLIRSDEGWLEIAWSDDAFGTRTSKVRFDASAGTNYYFSIASYGPDIERGAGNLVFSLMAAVIPPVSNDDFANATQVTALPFSDKQEVTGSTPALDDPTNCDYVGPHTVWYALTLAQDTDVWVDPGGTWYGAVIGIYTGQQGSLISVTCSGGIATLRAQAGVTYYIMVADYSFNTSDLLLSLAIYEAPPPLEISATIDRFGSVVPATGEASVHGTVTCNQPSYMLIQATIEQRTGVRAVQGWVYGDAGCSPGEPVEWTATVYSSMPVPPLARGRAATMFTAGQAVVWDLSVSAADMLGQWIYSSLPSQEITLRGR